MASLLARLLPQEKSFFVQFTAVAENIEAGARALVDLLEDYRDVEKKIAHIKDLEHRGDQMTHELFTQLNQTFITPFDREDIYELASKLDDVLDLLDAAATRLGIYRIERPRAGAAELAHIVLKSAEAIRSAVVQLEKHDRIFDHCVEINRLENEADRMVRSLIAKLFEEEKNPVEIIKWKELFEVLEIATDKCEDVANVLEGVVLKSA